MLGTKYLSQLVSPSMLSQNKLNIIKAPTGSGKTYFALTAIPSAVEDPAHRIVYLIDTINGKEQILQNYNARPLYRMWETELDGIIFDNDTVSRDVTVLRAKRETDFVITMSIRPARQSASNR